MKIKAILLGLVLSGISAFGQGMVSFQNNPINAPIRYTNSTDQVVNIPAGGNAFSFYFIYGTTSENLNNTSATFFNSATQAGRIQDSAASISLALPGGTPLFFQMFAYSTSAGSVAGAQTTAGASWYESGIITTTPAISPSPATPLFGVAPGTQFQGFTMNLTPVPEPSTIALGILGAGSLLFLRRKK